MRTPKLLTALFSVLILSCLSASLYADWNAANADQAIAGVSAQMPDSDQVGTQYWFPPNPYPPPGPYGPGWVPPRPVPPGPYGPGWVPPRPPRGRPFFD